MNDLSGPDSHVHLPGDQSNHTVGMDPGLYHPFQHQVPIHCQDTELTGNHHIQGMQDPGQPLRN